MKMTKKESAALFLATGFNIGRLSRAPGTLGSLEGVLLACLIHQLPGPWLTIAVISVILGAVFVAGQAARAMQEKDPSIIVADEIAGMVVCLSMFTCSLSYAVSCFALFRLFDIWKPWPVHSLEKLPGGWGIVMDDVMAGVMTGAVVQAGVMLSHAW